MKKRNKLTDVFLLGCTLVLVLGVGGCASGGGASGPVTEAQPISSPEYNSLVEKGRLSKEMGTLYIKWWYDENAAGDWRDLNAFRNSDGDLVTINLHATSKGGRFAGDELLVNNLRTAHDQTFGLVNNGRQFSLDGRDYTLYSDFNSVKVVEDFGERQAFTLDLDKYYRRRFIDSTLGTPVDINGDSYSIGDQGGSTAALLFFDVPYNQPADTRDKPVYVVPIAKVTDSGDTVLLGHEIPIADTGYEVKFDASRRWYIVKAGP